MRGCALICRGVCSVFGASDNKDAHLDSGGEASKRRPGEISAPSVRKFCLLSLDPALRTPRLNASAVAKRRTQGEQTMTTRQRLLIAAAAILLAGGVHMQRAAAG